MMCFAFFYLVFSHTSFENLTFEVLVRLALTTALLMLPFIVMFWSFHRTSLTEFNDHGITQYNFIGKTSIAWGDVATVFAQQRLFEIRIKSRTGKIVAIRLAVYKKPDEVIEFVLEKIRRYSTGIEDDA